MDLVLKLREIRRLKGLSQKDVARLSGVGEKTISSFETGERVGAMKLCQLKRLLAVYEISEAEFFGGGVEKQIAPWELNEEEFATTRLIEDLHHLPKPVQKVVIAKMQVMLETATDLQQNAKQKRPLYVQKDPEWRTLTSRN